MTSQIQHIKGVTPTYRTRTVLSYCFRVDVKKHITLCILTTDKNLIRTSKNIFRMFTHSTDKQRSSWSWKLEARMMVEPYVIISNATSTEQLNRNKYLERRSEGIHDPMTTKMKKPSTTGPTG